MTGDKQPQSRPGNTRNSLIVAILIFFAGAATGIAALLLILHDNAGNDDVSELAVASPTATAVDEHEQAADSPSPTSVVEPAFEPPNGDDNTDSKPEPVIDPLFVTYVCNDRADPTYPAAVEQWGYLTHGGKELMCLEYLEGNHGFVGRHQQLIRDSEIIPASELTFHDNNPDECYRNLLESGDIGLGGPPLSSTTDAMGYADIEVMLQARTPLDDALTLHQIKDFTEGWVNWFLGRPTNHKQDSSTPGELLARTLVSPDATHLAARLNWTRETVGKHWLLETLVRSSMVGSVAHGSREVVMTRLSRLADEYHVVSSQGEFNGPFDEWLLENDEVFLSQFWPDADWTPNDP